jgi:hypothetical protein
VSRVDYGPTGCMVSGIELGAGGGKEGRGGLTFISVSFSIHTRTHTFDTPTCARNVAGY